MQADPWIHDEETPCRWSLTLAPACTSAFGHQFLVPKCGSANAKLVSRRFFRWLQSATEQLQLKRKEGGMVSLWSGLYPYIYTLCLLTTLVRCLQYVFLCTAIYCRIAIKDYLATNTELKLSSIIVTS